MKALKKSRVIIEHRKECIMTPKANPWSGIVKGSYWGNWNATKNVKKGDHHLWYMVSCNDPNCPGIKAVHASVLCEA
jgi:predicted RNA-binding protein with PUA-like domain